MNLLPKLFMVSLFVISSAYSHADDTDADNLKEARENAAEEGSVVGGQVSEDYSEGVENLKEDSSELWDKTKEGASSVTKTIKSLFD